jgi:hypothetical protein
VNLAADPSWWHVHGETVIVTIVGVVATIVVAVAVAYRQRQTKILDWHLVTDEPIMTEHAPTGLTVSYRGESLTEPRIAVVRIYNAGTREIVEEDFRQTLTIQLSAANVVQVEIPKHSDNFLPKGSIVIANEGKVHVQDVFFNRNAWVELRIMADGGQRGDLKVEAVFVGQTRAMQQGAPQPTFGQIARAFALVTVDAILPIPISRR